MTGRIGNTILWIVASVVICVLGVVVWLQGDRLRELRTTVKKQQMTIAVLQREVVLVRNAMDTFEYGYRFVGK